MQDVAEKRKMSAGKDRQAFTTEEPTVSRLEAAGIAGAVAPNGGRSERRVATAKIGAGLTAEAHQGSLPKDIEQLAAFTTTQHGLGKRLHHHRVAIAVAVAAEQ